MKERKEERDRREDKDLARDFVELLGELAELRDLGHDLVRHEHGRRQRRVAGVLSVTNTHVIHTRIHTRTPHYLCRVYVTVCVM